MKKFSGVLVVIAAFGLVFWWFYKTPALPASKPKVEKIQPFPMKKKEGLAASIKEALPKNPYESWTGGPSQGQSDSRWQEVRRRKALDKSWQWKMPINFYGKVVDENEQPVEGAHIKLDWNDQSARGTSYSETVSDANGFFSLTGVQGKILGVRPEKEGYYTSLEQNRFVFEYAAFWEEKSYHEPDPSNPVIFHLKKKGEAEPMVHKQTLFGFGTDGTPGYLNLLESKNRKERSGDFSVQLVRGPEDERRRYDWTLVFEAVGGELLESNEEFMLLAPESGYQQSIEIKQSKDDPQWKMELKKKFYVKDRDGKFYARVEAAIISRYNDQAAINMTYYVNPSGSRNLEYDPNKSISPQRIKEVGLEKAIEEAKKNADRGSGNSE